MGYVRFSIPPDSFDFRQFKIEWAEWVAIRPCKATYTVSVANGSTSVGSSRSPMKLMFIDDKTPGPLASFEPVDGVWTSGSCWAPEGDEIRNMPISPLQWYNDYTPFISDANTMAFCTHTMRSDWSSVINDRLSSNITLRTSFTNTLLVDNTTQGLYSSKYVPSGASPDSHLQVTKRTLGPVMLAMTAALNNITGARSREEHVTGFFQKIETIVEVRWAWLALPITLEGLGVAFLLAVMFCRRRAAGPWKDSLLAIVYNGLDRQDDTLHGETVWRMADINEAAMVTRVKLLIKPTEDGGKVVLGSPAP
ncbi:hypothetical protein QBC44DRAFT_363652 [Cladorrhinum sp. PSN332]|nr:hypothetical protein QBC44DRAFT_363652 [Cladorrhinum sp. PSN332]